MGLQKDLGLEDLEFLNDGMLEAFREMLREEGRNSDDEELKRVARDYHTRFVEGLREYNEQHRRPPLEAGDFNLFLGAYA